MAQDSPKPRNVYIDDERYAWLQAQAARAGTTISRVLRDAISLARDWDTVVDRANPEGAEK